MVGFHVPLILRGRLIEDRDLEFGGRGGRAAFSTPDVRRHLAQLALRAPSDMADLYALRFNDVLDYLDALGGELEFSRNDYLRESYELAVRTSGLGQETIKHFYQSLPGIFSRNFVRELAENAIGVKYLDGWVERRMASGCVCSIRAFGARAVHILAGNVPIPSALGVVRNAITRSDAIFKTPSNDPLTAAAVARTMIEEVHDGSLTFESQRGAGTTARIVLPRTRLIERADR